MTWKVLIADDEPMIRADLRETVLTVLPGADMTEVLRLFEESNQEELPCIDADGKFIGFIARFKALEAYRNQVVDLLEDQE